jgi:hypothetical protein
VKGIFLSFFRFSHLLILWSFVIAGLSRLQEVVIAGLTRLQELVIAGLTRTVMTVIAGFTRNPLTVVKHLLIPFLQKGLLTVRRGLRVKPAMTSYYDGEITTNYT